MGNGAATHLVKELMSWQPDDQYFFKVPWPEGLSATHQLIPKVELLGPGAGGRQALGEGRDGGGINGTAKRVHVMVKSSYQYASRSQL